MSLLAELQRRNVVRVAVLYVASTWIILQIVETIGSLLDLPAWVGKLVLLALALGLPVALGVSWAYELTPEGLKRDSSVLPSESRRHANAHRLNVLTLVVAVLAMLTVAVDRYLPNRGLTSPGMTDTAVVAATTPATSGAQTPRPATGIAVLPFANMSSDAEQDFFSDGVTEEILNLLSNVEGLRVTSRTSSFSFKGQTADLPTIARKLGVSHVVEGSVRRAGDRVRVTAQLIDVASDTHLWSETYERKLDDVFAIQVDIAGHIARALQIALGTDDLASMGRPPTTDTESWQRFLQARYKLRNRKTAADLNDVLKLVDAAIERDPNFARAHSLRALALLLQPSWQEDEAGFEAQRSNKPSGQESAAREASWSEVLGAANRALELDPTLGEPYAVRALHAQAHNLYADAYRNFKEAVTRAPSDPEIRNWYGAFLMEVGYLQAGWAERQRAGELDPLSPLIAWQVGYAALIMNRPDVIEAYSAKARENGWEGPEPIALEGGGASERGDMDRAEQLWIKALPHRAEEIRMSMRAVRNRHVDAETARMLATLAPYGPPGIARFAIQALSGDVDGALATIHDTIDPASLRKPDGTGGPARSRGGDGLGSVLRADWWMHESSPMRADPRFAALLRDIGVVDFWREFGWPDKCQPVTGGVQCK